MQGSNVVKKVEGIEKEQAGKMASYVFAFVRTWRLEAYVVKDVGVWCLTTPALGGSKLEFLILYKDMKCHTA